MLGNAPLSGPQASSRPVRVGVMLSAVHSLEWQIAALEAYEQAGLDSFWLPDHLLGLYHQELWPEFAIAEVLPDCDAYLDPFALAAVMGQRTSATLGTSVTDGVRRRGVDLARTALTLNQ